jgi:rod shape-determining protein MreD
VSRNREIFLGAVVVLAFMLQLSVMPQFKVFGVQPDLILVVAVIVAVQEGPIAGAVVGFAGGMLQDIVSPQLMGVSALTKTLAAFFAGAMKDFFMTYSILLPVVLVFLATIFEMSMHQVALLVLGQEQLPPFKLSTMVIAALYNVLMVLVLYPFMRRFKFPQKEDSIVLSKPGKI